MSRLLRHSFVPALLVFIASSAHAAGVPDDCRQLIVGLAPDWNSMNGVLRRFERSDAKGAWHALDAPVPVLFGKHGLAWGRGLAGQDEPGLHKTERDGRAPAGVFEIGKIYTYDDALPAGADFPFHQVTKADAWIDDPTRPDYNRFVTIEDPANPPPWFQKQKMRHNDFAYRWLVEIRHNSDPPVPNEGSAIFFHIRRGPQRPSSGCTTMAEPALVKLITWLRREQHPCYVLLPREVYREKAQAWDLPALELIASQEKF
jgi:L,D-peptidoglycan transpeptidase YkuD (ErfK/YbiS/YcfS/YnhG family)